MLDNAVFLLTSIFLLTVLFSLLLKPKNSKSSDKSQFKSPPGPPSYFLLGCLPSILHDGNLRKYCRKCVDKYGGIFRSDVGIRRIVGFAKLDILSEALKHKDFQGRPNLPSFRIRGGHGDEMLGITTNEGKVWSEQRKFTVRTLKELGIGKASMEVFVADAAQQLTLNFKRRIHQPLNPQGVFCKALHMILLRILTGIDLALDDPKLSEIYEQICGGDKTFFTDKFYAPYNILPKLTLWFPTLTGMGKLKNAFQVTHTKLQEIIDAHKKTIDPHNPRDFIDLYLNKINETDDPSSGFFKEQGVKNMKAAFVDLFGGESEPGSWTLAFAFLYVGLHPKVKTKVQEEIDRVLGSRMPTWEDRFNLPYIEATLAETFRKNSITHFGIPRSATADTVFRGYFIEKGTVLMPWLYGVHHDKEYWGADADEFNPERFLIENPDGSVTFNKEKIIMPFGFGPRSCPGEQLARMANFLYFTSVLQQLDFQFDPASPVPSMEPEEGLVLSPKPYKIIFTQRDSPSL